MDLLYKPWPWYVAGPVIGLVVPVLLLLGNRTLGISSTFRQICAVVLPSRIPLFNYDWKKDTWNLVFAAGLVLGGWIGGVWLANPSPVAISASTQAFLHSSGLTDLTGYLPSAFFGWTSLFSLKGFIQMIVGGFLVGFGTRYARGCTSGHGILGLASLQWPSLVATACFFGGGILVARFVLPYVLSL